MTNTPDRDAPADPGSRPTTATPAAPAGPAAPDSPDGRTESAPPLLEIDAVDVFYGSAQALHQVSLSVQPGEIVSLLGGNACGKSTTMKVILGLVRPRTGEVRLNGSPITHLPTPARVRKGIASVPEARRMFPDMSIEENLRVGAYTRTYRKGVQADIQLMYEYFPRLAERRRQNAGTLSGGEQQMLAFARALMSRPRLVCMDEPTMGLSPLFVDRVLDMIVEINARLGVAVLMVEQNAELALSIASRGYVLQTGELTLAGPAAGLMDNPLVQEAYLGRVAA